MDNMLSRLGPSDVMPAVIATIAFAICIGFTISLPISLDFFIHSRSLRKLLILALVSIFLFTTIALLLATHKVLSRVLREYPGHFIFLFVTFVFFSFSFSGNAKFSNKTFHPIAVRCASIFDYDMTRELSLSSYFSDKSQLDRVGRKVFSDDWLKRDVILWSTHEIASSINHAQVSVRIKTTESDRTYHVICVFGYWLYETVDFYPNKLVKYEVSGNDRTHLVSSMQFREIRR